MAASEQGIAALGTDAVYATYNTSVKRPALLILAPEPAETKENEHVLMMSLEYSGVPNGLVITPTGHMVMTRMGTFATDPNDPYGAPGQQAERTIESESTGAGTKIVGSSIDGDAVGEPLASSEVYEIIEFEAGESSPQSVSSLVGLPVDDDDDIFDAISDWK